MTRRVQIARASATPASTAMVSRLHDLGNRVIVGHPTPGRGGEGIARDVLQALGKRFRDRTPRDPMRLQALAAIWLRAELARELVIAAADRLPASDWKLLRDLCGDSGTQLSLVVEGRQSRGDIAVLGDEVRELTLAQLVDELPPPTPPDTWGIFDESGSPDDRLDYPPVPDVDFAFFPSACVDLLPEHDDERVIRAFERARATAMLWLELRRGIEKRHGPSPRHAHAFLDTLVAACVTVDGAITVLRGAQAAFLLDGTLLEIDADAFAADHEAHAGAPAINATATVLRSYPEPHLAAVGALASATTANAEQIAGLTLASVVRVDASFTSGHRIAPPFRSLLAAQTLARRRRRGRRAVVPRAGQRAARHVAARSQLARSDRARDRSALRLHVRMEPLRDPRMGNLSPARRRAADRALSAPAGEPAARSGRAPSQERVSRAFAAGRYSDSPGYPGRGPVHDLDVHRTADDRAVEALLASIKTPRTAQQLATGLGWTLDRTVDALQRLEAGLANTGQILTRLGHHSYTLQPRPGLLNDREIARCLRHNREPLDLTAAAVLHRALTCSPEDRARDALTSPAEHTAAERLIAAGLLKTDRGFLRPTPRVKPRSGHPLIAVISDDSHSTRHCPASPPGRSRLAFTDGCHRGAQPLSSTRANR